MNLFLISSDSRETDLLKCELTKAIPAIHIDVCPGTQDILPWLSTPGICDIIVLDATVSNADAINLVSIIRKERKPIGIIALMGTADTEFPADRLKSGVDHFVLKRPGYVAFLAEMLQQLTKRYHSQTTPPRRQVRLLYAGNFETAQRHLSNVPQIKLEAAFIAPDGSLQQPETGGTPADALILESAITGANTLNIIKESNRKMPEVPVILLSDPGDDETAVHAMRAGAADCIAKTGNYFHRLLLVLQREIARRELIRERTLLRSREERLRRIVESMPTGVTVIAPDGVFLAVNEAGLRLMGATRLDQIVGKNIVDLMSDEDRQRLLIFLSTVCRGASTSIRLSWKGLDGSSLTTEFRAVPMRRDASGSMAALTVIYADYQGRDDQTIGSERNDLEDTAKKYEAKLRELQEKQSQQDLKWGELLRESESGRIAAEEQRDKLKSAVEEAANHHRLLLEEQRTERETWEQARQGFREQCNKIEGVAESLRTAQINLREVHKDEQTQWEIQRQELGQKQQTAERQLAELSEALLKERSQWEIFRQELEQKYQAAEERRITHEIALNEAESKIAQLTETHNSELTRRDAAYHELEQKFQTAEEQSIARQTALEAAQSLITQASEARISEITQRDLTFQELEQKCKSFEVQMHELQSSLHLAESSLAGEAETHNSELTRRDAAYHELEQKFQTAEEQSIARQTALEAAQSLITQASEAHISEITQRDLTFQELEQKCKSFEAQIHELQSALHLAESSLAGEAETHNSELTRRDAAYHELEQKFQTAEEQSIARQTALEAAQSLITQASEARISEITQRDLTFQELEQKCKSFEAQIHELQSALHLAESSLAGEAEIHNSELSRRDAAYDELEEKLQAAEAQIVTLKNSVRDANSSLARMTEIYNSESSRHDAAYSEHEQKLQAAENQLKAVESKQSNLEQIIEALKAELSKRDLEQRELESKFQTVEKQRIALQNALHKAESSLEQINEKHEAELSQRDFSQKKAEQKFQAAEKQRIDMEDALKNTQSALTQLTEKHHTEQVQWEILRQELEQKCQAAEEQQAIAMQNAVRETESRLAWISEQNQAKATQVETLQQELEQLKIAYGQVTAAGSLFHLPNQQLSKFTSVGVVLATRDGRVLQCNDAAARIFGYTGAEEALSQASQSQFRIYAFEGSLDARLQQEGKLETIEWSTLGRDGRLIRIQESATLVDSPTGDGPLVERILTDISKIHKLSEEVRRARRMESTGNLATATVKSLKELCVSLTHSGELLMKSPNDIDTVRRLAATLLSDANRGVKHARYFLSTAMKADPTPVMLNLNDILAKNDALLHSLIGEDIDLQTTLTPQLGLVSADHNEVVQLIGSLLVTSREALPLGGTVTIKTSNIEIESLAAGYPSGLKPGIYVQLAFSADGCTVQPERRAGSNRTLAERIGGYLEIANDPQLGNISRLYLPRVEAGPDQAVPLANTTESLS